MQVRAESGKSALPICNYSQILYQFLTFTQNLKRSQMILWNKIIDTYDLHLVSHFFSFLSHHMKIPPFLISSLYQKEA